MNSHISDRLRKFEQDIIHDLMDCEEDEDREPTNFVPRTAQQIEKDIEEIISDIYAEDASDFQQQLRLKLKEYFKGDINAD